MKKNNEIRKPFAAFLDHLLNVEKKCTQVELGAAVGYVQASVSALALGKVNGSESKRRAISEYFGYSYDEFLKKGQSIIDGTFHGIQPIHQDAPTQAPPQRRKTDIEIQADKTHERLVGRFVDKETALKINQLLIRLEELENGDGLKAALEWAEYRVHQAEKKRGLPGTGTES